MGQKTTTTAHAAQLGNIRLYFDMTPEPLNLYILIKLVNLVNPLCLRVSADIPRVRLRSSMAQFTLLFLVSLGFLSFSSNVACAGGPHPIDVNAASLPNAPEWLKASRFERVVDTMESKLEWDVRKIQARWHDDAAEFRKLHGYDDSVLAFTSGADTSVHFGPRVTSQNFDAVFGHELTHVILRQKYKNAVPRWLEEGLANYLSKLGKVDYAWLAAQPPRDATSLAHPFAEGGNSSGVSTTGARYHYQASQALMEMIASKCAPQDLLQMSVGKKLESYLPTLCGINDINAEFRAWVARKARATGTRG
jgi:hypothetical protein